MVRGCREVAGSTVTAAIKRHRRRVLLRAAALDHPADEALDFIEIYPPAMVARTPHLTVADRDIVMTLGMTAYGYDGEAVARDRGIHAKHNGLP